MKLWKDDKFGLIHKAVNVRMGYTGHEEFGTIGIKELISHWRKREVVDARIQIATLCLDHGVTTLVTGFMLGRNHSTIVHYRKMHRDLVSDPDYRKSYDWFSGQMSDPAITLHITQLNEILRVEPPIIESVEDLWRFYSKTY